jgi:transcription-repair coupling factor (superfamily II helicase)
MEHWLPLFHERLDTLLDYLPGVPFVFDTMADDAAAERLAQVKDYYDARHAALTQPQPASRPTSRSPAGRPLHGPEEWAERTARSRSPG